jgi:thiamine-phosphate pyrophosphorylase
MNYKGSLLRIIDSNINRAKEGTRVCEDIMRFTLNDKGNSAKLRKIRHDITNVAKTSQLKIFEIIKNRDSKSDVGRKFNLSSSKNIVSDIFAANSQRVKEALRVLEEMFCVFDASASKQFQNLRFSFYDLEKDCFKKIARL